METMQDQPGLSVDFEEYTVRVAGCGSPPDTPRSDNGPPTSPAHGLPSRSASPGEYDEDAGAGGGGGPFAPVQSQTVMGWRSPALPPLRRLPSLTGSQSAPMLSAPWSPQMSKTFHATSSRTLCSFHAASGSSSASTAYGKVPRWGRGAQLRTLGALERELTWAYYQIRQSPNHPMRKKLGECLPVTDVPAEMRRGERHYFYFWRDCRPPFRVVRVERLDEPRGAGPATGGADGRADVGVGAPGRLDGGGGSSGAGRLYRVAYECGIEHVGERTYGETASESTFNNMVRGAATVRTSDALGGGCAEVLSWGRPLLIPKPEPVSRPSSSSSTRRKTHDGVPADQWNPLASVLGLRPNHPRLARSRRAAERLSPSKGPEVDVLQRVLLGCHTHKTLPRLAHHLEETSARAAGGDGCSLGSGAAGALPWPPPEGASLAGAGCSAVPSPERKRRERRIWTQAAGFVSYVG